MPDFKDPAVIAFYNENLKKEKTLRLKWFYRNLERIQQCATAPENVALSESEAGLEKYKEEAKSLPNNRFLRKKYRPPPDVTKPEKSYPMKPVEPEVKALIYSSILKDGAEKYLRQRKKKSPEEKFYNIDCTSWTYGWDLKQSVQKPMEKQKPRSEVIKKTIFRKSGIGADPIHYKRAI